MVRRPAGGPRAAIARAGGSRGLLRRGLRPAGSFGAGAALLSIGLAATGLLSFAFFSLASHALDGPAYKRVTLLWSVMVIVLAVIYRPVEQLLARTIAARRASGADPATGARLRLAIGIQAGFAAGFLVVALLLRDRIEDGAFDGSATLFWALVAGVVGYAASYIGRGWLAGHGHFLLYGGLTVAESLARLLVALLVIVGLAHGQSAIAVGMAIGALPSLVIVPVLLARWGAHGQRAGAEPPGAMAADSPAGPAGAEVGELTAGEGTAFAVSAFAIMLAEQTFLNAAVLIADAGSSNPALGGYVFNVLLISRAPLLLFQAVQTSLLPHLAGLQATDGAAAFERAIRVTLRAISAFALLVALALLAIGPFAIQTLFGHGTSYARGGLAIIALGVGLHLMATTLTQAALARRRAGRAALAWLACAVLFAAFNAVSIVGDRVLRVELAYAAGTLALVLSLAALHRRGRVAIA